LYSGKGLANVVEKTSHWARKAMDLPGESHIVTEKTGKKVVEHSAVMVDRTWTIVPLYVSTATILW
jgi:hypothetical protein